MSSALRAFELMSLPCVWKPAFTPALPSSLVATQLKISPGEKTPFRYRYTEKQPVLSKHRNTRMTRARQGLQGRMWLHLRLWMQSGLPSWKRVFRSGQPNCILGIASRRDAYAIPVRNALFVLFVIFDVLVILFYVFAAKRCFCCFCLHQEYFRKLSLLKYPSAGKSVKST